MPLPRISIAKAPRGAAAAPAGFDPAADPALVFRLDPSGPFRRDTAGTQPCADGDPCAYWGDLSGQGFHATRLGALGVPTYRAAALGGLPGLWFPGDGSCLSPGAPAALAALQSGAVTVMVAAARRGGSAGAVLSKGAGSTTFDHGVFTSDGQHLGSDARPGPAPADGTFFTCGLTADPLTGGANGLVRFYNDGRPYGSTVAARVADSSGPVVVGARAGGAQPWQGWVFAVSVYARALSPVECWRWDSCYRRRFGLAWPGAGQPAVVWDGGSAASGFTLLSRVLGLANLNAATGINLAWDGKTGADMASRGAGEVDALLALIPAGPKVVVHWGLGDDLAPPRSEPQAQAYAGAVAYAAARRAGGATGLVLGTCLPRTDVAPGGRDALNAALRAGVPALPGLLADPAADAAVGQDGQATNATYYADGVHLTAAGEARVAPAFAAAVAKAAAPAVARPARWVARPRPRGRR